MKEYYDTEYDRQVCIISRWTISYIRKKDNQLKCYIAVNDMVVKRQIEVMK